MQLPIAAGATGRDTVHARLTDELPEPLRPLADVALNLHWTWTPDGADVFAALGAQRWTRVDHNAVRMIVETPAAELARAAEDDDLVARVGALHDALRDDLERPARELHGEPGPVAFLCAEYGLHRSVRIYSGGLGILAGDILKESSDLALPVVGVGILYRSGYFRQRLDSSGWQHEYWVEADPETLPLTPVLDSHGAPLTVTVPTFDREIVARIHRLDVGRVPLFLLDADVPENSAVDRFVTARLYDQHRDVRLLQYATLGIGGLRALHAIGLEPSTLHLNEGHAAMAMLELVVDRVGAGESLDDAVAAVSDRGVFTTHTPVPAGNETYEPSLIARALSSYPGRLGVDESRVLGLGRVHPDDEHSEAGMTPVAMRTARRINGVSERHGEVARGMWSPLFRVEPDDVPITHVTNGVHVATWTGRPMRELLDAHLGDDWTSRAGRPETWKPIGDIDDAALWQARCDSRELMLDALRDRIATDRLRRGEVREGAMAALEGLRPDRLTLGFARRAAAYKRLYLLRQDADRALRLLQRDDGPQLLFAGKAHPADDGSKSILQSMFELKGAPQVAHRVAFLEDYDMPIGHLLTTGCDVWVNVPRPPLEASGTSGMKCTLNGGLNLSVLDGWWAEGYDGHNGWAIDGAVDDDHGAQDRRHADQLYTLLEDEVVPLFADRGSDGVPRGWVAMVKRAMTTMAWRFSATRMMEDYAERIYARR